MAEPVLSDDQPLPSENDVLLPRGWDDAWLSQLEEEGDDEPNVLRGLN